MNQTIQLNNKAVSCLQQGNAFDACNYLTEASGICLQIMDGQQHNAGGTNVIRRRTMIHRDHVITWVNFTTSKAARHYNKTYLCNDDSSSNSDTDVDHCPPSMYHYAATIRTTCCRPRRQQDLHCSKCIDDTNICPCSIAPIVWYNLALCCQLLGGELHREGATNDCTFYYMRSLYLYDKVLNIFSKGNKDCQGLSTLLLAVLNNQACIYYEMGRHSECIYLMNRLKQSLEFAASASSSSSNTNPNNNNNNNRRNTATAAAAQRNWGVFHMNMIMMDTERPRPAAAA